MQQHRGIETTRTSQQALQTSGRISSQLANATQDGFRCQILLSVNTPNAARRLLRSATSCAGVSEVSAFR